MLFKRLFYKSRLSRISLIITDVDGVLTDGKIIVGDSGEEMKNFSAKDGFAVSIGRRLGLNFAVVTGRDTKAVITRLSSQLKIKEIKSGRSFDKEKAVEEISKSLNIGLDKAAFVGDELIDIKAMRLCSFSFAPSDASLEVKKTADIVTKSKGGEGVLREVVMLILKSQGRYDEAISLYS